MGGTNIRAGIIKDGVLGPVEKTATPSEATGEELIGALAQLIEKLDLKSAEAIGIYFARRYDGTTEELTLKTNEITRNKSVFLEGTYALHGIEEVMNQSEELAIIDPFEQEEEKFKPYWPGESESMFWPSRLSKQFS